MNRACCSRRPCRRTPRGGGKGGGFASFLTAKRQRRVTTVRFLSLLLLFLLRIFCCIGFLLLLVTTAQTTSSCAAAAAAAATNTVHKNALEIQQEKLSAKVTKGDFFQMIDLDINNSDCEWIVVIGKHFHHYETSGNEEDDDSKFLLHAQFYLDKKNHNQCQQRNQSKTRKSKATATTDASSTATTTATLDAVVCPLLSGALHSADSVWSKNNNNNSHSLNDSSNNMRMFLSRAENDCHNRSVVDLRPFSSTLSLHQQEEEPRFTLVASWTSTLTATVAATAQSRMPVRVQQGDDNDNNNNKSRNETATVSSASIWQWYYIWENHRIIEKKNEIYAPSNRENGKGIILWKLPSPYSLEEQKAASLRNAPKRIQTFVIGQEQAQQFSFSTMTTTQPDSSSSKRKKKNAPEATTSIDLQASLSQTGGMHRKLQQTLSIIHHSKHQAPAENRKDGMAKMLVWAQLLLVLPPEWFPNVEDAIERQQPPMQQSDTNNCSFRLIEPPGQVINQEEPSFVSRGYAVLLEWQCHTFAFTPDESSAAAAANFTLLHLEWNWLLHSRYLEPLDDHEGDFRQIALLPPVIWSVTMQEEVILDEGTEDEGCKYATSPMTVLFESHSAWLDTSSSQKQPTRTPMYTYMAAGKKVHMVPVLVITSCVALAGAALVLHDLFRLTSV